MSASALVTAVRDEVRSHASLNDWQCDVRLPPGKPPATSGDTYVSIVLANWRNGVDLDHALDEYYDVDLIITRRTGKIPLDRMAWDEFYKDTTGCEALARLLIGVMYQQRYNILTAANTILYGADPPGPGETFWKIYEPLRWVSNTGPTDVGPEWFGAEPADVRSYGYTYTISFRDARRGQPISELVGT